MAKITGSDYLMAHVKDHAVILNGLLQGRHITIDGVTTIALGGERWDDEKTCHTIWEVHNGIKERPLPGMTLSGFLDWMDKAKEIKISFPKSQVVNSPCSHSKTSSIPWPDGGDVEVCLICFKSRYLWEQCTGDWQDHGNKSMDDCKKEGADFARSYFNFGKKREMIVALNKYLQKLYPNKQSLKIF